MTDPSSTPSSSDQPSTPPPAASTPPAYTPSSSAGAAGAPAKKGLSIAGFILGIASIVLSGFAIISIPAGVVGVILSILARNREPGAPNWMKMLGLILSIVGIVLSIIWIVVAAALVASAGTYN